MAEAKEFYELTQIEVQVPSPPPSTKENNSETALKQEHSIVQENVS